MERRTDLLEILQYIDPAMLDYQDWINVGMALKAEGYDRSAWDAWSQADGRRYHPGDCTRKWESFGAAPPHHRRHHRPTGQGTRLDAGVGRPRPGLE